MQRRCSYEVQLDRGDERKKRRTLIEDMRRCFSLYLVTIKIFQNRIEHGVEIVEEIDHFHGTAQGRDGRKTNDIREINRHTFEPFGFDCFAGFQTFRNGSEARRRSE